MANVKEVLISGSLPFNCSNHDGMRSYLGHLNAPCIGVGIMYGKRESYIPNEHGGVTTMYNFVIQGQEALSQPFLTGLILAIRACGGQVLRAQCRDVENNTGWEDIAV